MLSLSLRTVVCFSVFFALSKSFPMGPLKSEDSETIIALSLPEDREGQVLAPVDSLVEDNSDANPMSQPMHSPMDSLANSNAPIFCQGLPCPAYQLLLEEASYEIRDYDTTLWVGTISHRRHDSPEKLLSAELEGSKCTPQACWLIVLYSSPSLPNDPGYERLVSYFEGRNSAKAPIDITVPLAVRVSLEDEGHSFQVAMSLPPSIGIDPVPVPVRLNNLNRCQRLVLLQFGLLLLVCPSPFLTSCSLMPLSLFLKILCAQHTCAPSPEPCRAKRSSPRYPFKVLLAQRRRLISRVPYVETASFTMTLISCFKRMTSLFR
jgi:hypothetical protein